MSIKKDTRDELLKKYAISKNDTGSAQVQIAVLSRELII